MATPEYYKSLPMKRMGSGVLFFDSKGKFLLVRPSYKPNWEVPGGVVENNESPRKAAEREVKEELDLTVSITKLVCVDYQDPYDIKTESLMFIFDGGTLSNEQITSLKVDGKEIIEFRFVELKDAIDLLPPVLFRRVEQALAAKAENTGVYLENRELVI